MENAIRIEPVTTAAGRKRFIKFPWRVYHNDPLWVPQLIRDEMKILDPERGTFYQFGEAALFMAFRGREPVGRISAQVNHQYERYHDNHTGFFGFFECIDDQAVADALFGTAAAWLRNKGKSRAMGPMSFSMYDISGILIDGNDTMPCILTAYNPPYYEKLLDTAGMKKAMDWYAFLVSQDSALRPGLQRIASRVTRQEGLEIVPLDMKIFDQRVREVARIFSDAWMENWGHVPFTDGQVQDLVHELKMVIVPEVTLFALYHGECIGFSLSVKDANPALQKANGRLFPFGLFKVLWHLRKTTRLRTMAMGVLKEHRHRGIDIAFYLKTIEEGRRLGFYDSECSIILEINKRMIGALEDLSARRYKTFRFYEKEI
ncbi:MAG TPA: N-acetyltransferase [bacterium]|nr:N-acetyltransferase [bacterium]HQI47292.1 N-acetyltransferase [bacterium]HQJ63779.1 N-acetyltransferase [bacterium]